jgi:hypothetical protein
VNRVQLLARLSRPLLGIICLTLGCWHFCLSQAPPVQAGLSRKFVPPATAQIPEAYLSLLPLSSIRIAGPINDYQLIALPGNKHPRATAANDQGEVSPNQSLKRMLLLLRRGPEQETALANLMAAQQDRISSLFHKWLTPEQFGAWFGPAVQDVQAITNWLGAQGFTGISVSKGRTVIEFSGNAGQVKSAFHTAIHRYRIADSMHFANQSDPSIPIALAPVVTGVVSLNNFGYNPTAILGPTFEYAKGDARPHSVLGANPNYTTPGSEPNTFDYFVAPYDFATIYDLVPLWNSGLDGSGQTIAIVGQTDINLNDPEQFRAFLGLPVNNPIVKVIGEDPGTQADESESDLDVEWSGAIAKGAQIELVTSASTETTEGVDLSALYIVDNNLAPVLSESYSECELFLGTAGNAFEASLRQQAAAEGITFLVSSGDAGSAACDPTNPNQNVAVHPMAVSGLASTPYDVAVGGTDFNQYNLWSQYWSGNDDPTTKESVLGYIPEIPWNDSCGSTTLEAINGEEAGDGCSDPPLVVLNLNTIATGGGPSSCISADGSDATGCTGAWPKPAWQTGTGVPNDGVRDIPDVSLFASNGVYESSYILCQVDLTGSPGCDPTASQQTFTGVGGTSASVQAMAGVMAIINQEYGRQGNANPTLYRLAASSAGPSIFHEITTDGNRVACTAASPDCIIPAGAEFNDLGMMKGHDSTVGYDMVTGLGSIDIANLVNNWASVAFTPTSTTLSLNGGTATVTAVHGTPIQANAVVSASSGNPTGDVSLIGAATNGSVFLGTLSDGAATGNVDTLPGGNYSVIAYYGGDAQFAQSQSAPVNVNISPEPSATRVSLLNYNPTSETYSTAPSSVVYGSRLLIRSDTTGQSGYGVATGSVTFADTGTSLGQFPLNAQGTAEYVPSNSLLAGTHTLTASYSGDASFNAGSGSNSITVTPAPMTCALVPNTTVLRPGWSLTLNPTAELNQTLAPQLAGMVPPTGTMTIYSGTTAVVGPETVTGTGSSPTASISTATLQISQLTSLSAPITVVYSGDSNYATCTSPPLQLTYETSPIASFIWGTIGSQQSTPETPINLDIGVGPNAGPPPQEPAYPAPTGAVQLSIDGGNVGSPVSLTPAVGEIPNVAYGNYGAANLTIPTSILSPGGHVATVTYGGDANYLASGSPQWYFSIVIPDFSMELQPASLSVTNGQTTEPSTIQITSLNGFAGVVSFSCTGLPSGASCVFTPATVQENGSTALTITTTQAQDARTPTLARRVPGGRLWLIRAGGISFAFVVVLAGPRRRRKTLGLGFVVPAGLAIAVTSCGGGSATGASTQQTPWSTTTTMTAATTTPTKGENDTFTATVAGGPTPTGSVQFGVDGTASGSPVALSNGAAQFVTSFPTAGSHSVSGAYSGDASHSGSSNSITLNVPYTTGSIPGTYSVTITATSGTLTHTSVLTLMVN